MQDALLVLKQAQATLGELVGEAEKSVKTIEAREAQVAVDRNALLAMKDDLAAREIQIKKVEDIIKFKNEAIAAQKQAQVDRSKLSEERAEFDKYVANTRKEFQAKSEQQAQENERIERETKALIVEREALEKEKSEFKNNLGQAIIETASKNMKKR